MREEITMIQIVEQFKTYLMEDGKSPRTIESYIGDVTGLLTYLETMGVEFDGSLKRFFVTSYKNHLIEKNYQPNTINKNVNSLQSFNNFLVQKGIMNEVVVNLKKDRVQIALGSEQQVEVYSEKQIVRILFYSQNHKKVTLRDKMIFQLLIYTGVRVSELCDIKLKHIDFLTCHLKIVGKGGKIREIPLKLEVVEVIKEYLVERAASTFADSEYLVLGQRGALQRDAINTILEKYTKELGLGIKLKPHTFRHTFCTRLVSKGVPLTTVSKLAGHSSVETTVKFYINSSKEDKMNAVNLL